VESLDGEIDAANDLLVAGVTGDGAHTNADDAVSALGCAFWPLAGGQGKPEQGAGGGTGEEGARVLSHEQETIQSPVRKRRWYDGGTTVLRRWFGGTPGAERGPNARVQFAKIGLN
jgi:hypothetical protein